MSLAGHPIGRAWIGWPSRNRRRSSASARPNRTVGPGPSADTSSDRFEIVREMRLQTHRRHRFLLTNHPQRVENGGALERRAAGESSYRIDPGQ